MLNIVASDFNKIKKIDKIREIRSRNMKIIM